jgi:hypothetical protein
MTEAFDPSLGISPEGDGPLGEFECECFKADLRGEIDLGGG